MCGLMGYFWPDGLFSCHASPTHLKMQAMPTTVLPIMLGSYTQLYTARTSCLCCIFIGGMGALFGVTLTLSGPRRMKYDFVFWA